MESKKSVKKMHKKCTHQNLKNFTLKNRDPHTELDNLISTELDNCLISTELDSEISTQLDNCQISTQLDKINFT